MRAIAFLHSWGDGVPAVVASAAGPTGKHTAVVDHYGITLLLLLLLAAHHRCSRVRRSPPAGSEVFVMCRVKHRSSVLSQSSLPLAALLPRCRTARLLLTAVLYPRASSRTLILWYAVTCRWMVMQQG
jgi:hypothetical protein